MMDRRTFMSLLATAAVAPRSSFAQGAARKSALYSSVGPVLTHYDVDVEAAALTKRASVTLPANVQYAWPHASGRYLYVASSSSAPGTGPAGTEHHVSAFRIDPASGALAPHGNPIRLPTRPIHITTDIPSRHVLVAFNNPSALRVYRINGDATLGEEVQQRGPIDAGIYGHQVRVTANNRLAIFVARGNDPAGGKPDAGDLARHRAGTEAVHGDRPNEVSLPPFSVKTTTLTFDKPGPLTFICHFPQHEAYGMVGVVMVKP